ncbi:MAG: putative 2OG-Fe(II) oxygenase [Pseudomonadota bacterium]
MSGQISIIPAWPSTIMTVDWPEHTRHAPQIASHIYDLSSGYREPIASGVARSAKPEKGLIESPLNLFTSSVDPHLMALATWISSCVRACVSKVNGDEVPPDRLALEFTESWFHITNSGGFHDAHTHSACSWCGIFYVVAGESGNVSASGNDVAANGINRFYSPLTGGGMVRDYGNAYLGRSFLDVEPRDGRLVIFPSFLLHSALPYHGETDRIVIAFNTRSRIRKQ